ncbi:caspase family protein [Arthrobacter sp. Bz4]|uniref:caspase family protein n=1 Tax=Arthrobacter sp. Bz4 TaxID=2171979 RepID=UPI000D50E1BC|nr:caspase family protein [Arthrobacter sp. Bz4]PVE16914.1 peptidase C14 caspase catalytic subunit p20 [Arthrobacter sp. Bz4]
MAKYALCVGINKFENLPTNAWLNGCVNDAKDFAALLTGHYGFAKRNVAVLLDSKATKAAVVGKLQAMLKRAKPGDHLVFTFSSHGTQVLDVSGDEPDGADEAFVTFDMRQKGDQWDAATLILDDELHHLLGTLPDGVLLDVVLDTCHSGTGLRALDLLPTRRPRFVPPPTPLGLELTESADPRAFRDLVRSDAQAKPVLFAACRSDQTAADADFAGRYSGAFSHYLLQAVKDDPSASRRVLLKRVSADLRDGKFTQRAQLEAPVAAKSAAWGTAF